MGTLGLSSRDISDIKTLMLECGIGKSAKEELEELLEPLDAENSSKIKRTFNKALRECLQKATSGQTFL